MTFRDFIAPSSGAQRAGRCLVAGPVGAVEALLQRNKTLQVVGASLVGPGAPQGVPVLARAPAWDAFVVPESDAETLLLAERVPSRAAARHVLARAAQARLRVLIATPEAMRPLALDDLIGCEADEIDWVRIGKLIGGRRVMITGGGGSIGRALAQRVAAFDPARVILFDASEYNLFSAQRNTPGAKVVLGDVRDADAVERVFERERPEIVFHTAALKQVPMVEAHPCEGVLTNVVGCCIVADAAAAAGADTVFVSTDKAVNATGVMGATKRLAELYCQALDRAMAEAGGRPRAVAVRLGNVLGSAGSVTPLFEQQLAAGGPLTVTDPEVTRYFMTVAQAAEFLLQAAATARTEKSPRGAALVRDMGAPIAIVDLARLLIQLEGRQPDTEVGITFVGLRPGEKLHEQLIADEEWRQADPAPGVMAAAGAPRDLDELRAIIKRLEGLARAGDDDAVKAQLYHAIAAPEALVRASAS